MILYEVNVTVEPEIAEQYAAFLERHIPQILEIDGFLEARWWSEATSGRQTLWTIHYTVESRQKLEQYFARDAAKMRSEAIEAFGSRFAIQRRVLEGVKAFSGRRTDPSGS